MDPAFPFQLLLCWRDVALTGQGMAVARGASAATGQIGCCVTGAGPVANLCGLARGKPTTAPHYMP